MKTMAIRLDDDLHAQLQVLAQLSDTSITEVIRSAIDAHLQAKRHDPALVAQADSVLADIDAAAASRRDAIATLFAPEPKTGDGTRTSAGEEHATSRGRGRKTSG